MDLSCDTRDDSGGAGAPQALNDLITGGLEIWDRRA